MKIPAGSAPRESRVQGTEPTTSLAPAQDVPTGLEALDEPSGFAALRAEARSAPAAYGGRPLNDPRIPSQAESASRMTDRTLEKARAKLDLLAASHGQVEAKASMIGRALASIVSSMGETSSIPISGPELLALMASAKDLARIDGVRITYDDNVFGLNTPNTKKETVFVPARVLMGERYPGYLDDAGAASRWPADKLAAEALIASRFLGVEKVNVLGIEAVRKLDGKRAEFESHKKVTQPRDLAEGARVAVHFIDMFANRSSGFAKSGDGFSEYATGEVLRMSGENYMALEDGRVLRLNRQVFEVRTFEADSSPDRQETVDRAFETYGSTWGHNDNNGHGGAAHEFKRGEGVPAQVLNELRELVKDANPYTLSGIIVKYHDPATKGSRLATFSIHELEVSAFTPNGFSFPGLPPIPYTDVLGLKGRAGDGYGSLMATMSADS